MVNGLQFMAATVAALIRLNLIGRVIDRILLVSEFNHE
jgi:hypothetical protein